MHGGDGPVDGSGGGPEAQVGAFQRLRQGGTTESDPNSLGKAGEDLAVEFVDVAALPEPLAVEDSDDLPVGDDRGGDVGAGQ